MISRKILLMGLRKSGKTSIQRVVFENMEPNQSAVLPTTVSTEVHTCNDFLVFEVWDYPGQNDYFKQSPDKIKELLANCGVIVFVLDCREQVENARDRLIDTICKAYTYDPKLWVEVFVHKVDALSEDHQSDLLISLQRKVQEEVRQHLGNVTLHLSFNLTSIHDHSVFQAFSLVVQRLISAKLPKVNELLQMINSNCGSDAAYLFLSRSKIFLASDESKRMEQKSFDLCSDAIELLVKMSSTYDHPKDMTPLAGTPPQAAKECARAVVSLKSDSCIYVKEMPDFLTMVLMLEQSNLCNRALIDKNIDTCCQMACHMLTS